MNLSDGLIRDIKKLILFTAVVFLCLWKHEVALTALNGIIHIIYPFLIGGAIAFLINVPMNYIEKHLFPEQKKVKNAWISRIARPVSLLLVLAALLCLILAFFFILIPQLIRTWKELGQELRTILPAAQSWISKHLQDDPQVQEWVNGLRLDERSLTWWKSFLEKGWPADFFGSAVTLMRGIISKAAAIVVGFAFACYALLQKEQLKHQGRKLLYAFLPKGRADAVVEVLALTYDTFSSFLIGQSLEAVILGTMFLVSMLLFRMPYAVLIGLVIAVTALVPVFGAFAGCGIGFTLILIEDPGKAAGFLVLFLLLQQMEGNLIYPRVVGNSVGLPPIWVLASVSIGGSLMGVAGMILFIPLASVSYALFREIIALLLKKRGIDARNLHSMNR